MASVIEQALYNGLAASVRQRLIGDRCDDIIGRRGRLLFLRAGCFMASNVRTKEGR